MTPDNTDDMHEIIDMASKKIKAEIKNIEIDRKSYCGRVNKDICLYYQSNTLNDILTKVSKKLNQSLPALLIGNIITSIVKNLAIPLQIALAVLLRDSKEQVKSIIP